MPDLPNTSQILLYQTEDGQTRLEVRLEDETVRLSQRMLAGLFQKKVADTLTLASTPKMHSLS